VADLEEVLADMDDKAAELAQAAREQAATKRELRAAFSQIASAFTGGGADGGGAAAAASSGAPGGAAGAAGARRPQAPAARLAPWQVWPDVSAYLLTVKHACVPARWARHGQVHGRSARPRSGRQSGAPCAGGFWLWLRAGIGRPQDAKITAPRGRCWLAV